MTVMQQKNQYRLALKGGATGEARDTFREGTETNAARDETEHQGDAPTLMEVIVERGEPYIRSKDAAGLCAVCLEAGVSLPPRMLLRMCQTIVQLTMIDARFVLDTPEGASLYYVRMAIA